MQCMFSVQLGVHRRQYILLGLYCPSLLIQTFAPGFGRGTSLQEAQCLFKFVGWLVRCIVTKCDKCKVSKSSYYVNVKNTFFKFYFLTQLSITVITFFNIQFEKKNEQINKQN